MTYRQLVAQVSEATGQSPEAIRNVLFAAADALVRMKPGEMVRTPLGVFRMMIRRSRNVIPPTGDGRAVRIPAEMVVKLRAGTKLRRKS